MWRNWISSNGGIKTTNAATEERNEPFIYYRIDTLAIGLDMLKVPISIGPLKLSDM